MEGEQDADALAFPPDRWQDPVTPSPSFALEGPPADGTLTRHGPLNGSIDPAALFALETERSSAPPPAERTTCHGSRR